jgi:hypothetical protein
LLYDGSAEAQSIISNALDSLEGSQSDAETYAVGALMHTLDYLKGKNPSQYSAGVGPGEDIFSYTGALENIEELTEEEFEAIKNMTMDRSAVVESPEPGLTAIDDGRYDDVLVQITPAEKTCEPSSTT